MFFFFQFDYAWCSNKFLLAFLLCTFFGLLNTQKSILGLTYVLPFRNLVREVGKFESIRYFLLKFKKLPLISLYFHQSYLLPSVMFFVKRCRHIKCSLASGHNPLQS